MILKKILNRFWPILVILLLVGIFSRPYFTQGRVPFPSSYLVSFFPPWSASYGMPVKNNAMPDVITQIYPWKLLTTRSWTSGQIPLWNPFSFAGTPHAGNYQSAVFSPVNILPIVLGSIDGWSIAILLQPFLAGIFMYFFLRTLHATRSSATLASISFMFSGFLVVWMAYGTLGYAVLFLPLILGSLVRLYEKPSAWAIIGVSTGIALSLLSGHFQMSIYVVMATIAFAVFWAFFSRKTSRLSWSLISIVFGLTMAMPQLMASFDAYTQSVRSASFVKGEVIPWQYLVTAFSPDYYGNPVTRNDWFGHYAEWASFIGVIPLLLSFYAIVRRRRPLVWFFLSLGLVSLLLATPTPLNDLLFALKIPVLSTSAAGRIIMLLSFSLSVLSALGLDQIRQDWKGKNYKPFLRFASCIGMLIIFLWILLSVGQVLPADKLAIARRNSILPTTIAGIGIVAMLTAFFRPGVKYFILIVLLGVSSIDSLRFATKWMPFDPRAYMYPGMDVISFLTERGQVDRIFGNVGNELTGVFQLPSVEGYDALYQKRYGEFVRFADEGALKNPERSVVTVARGGAYSQRVLDLLGVRYIIHRLSDGTNVWAYPHWKYPFYTSVYKDDHYEIFENTHALPRFFLASRYELRTDREAMLRALIMDETFDRERILLEHAPPFVPQEGSAEVSLTRYTPNEVVFSVQSSADKLLFLSDVYEDGWKASVDGKETALLRANYAFRAVSVPAGTHEVRMFYRPRSVTIGIPVAIISFIVLILLARRISYDNRHL